MYEEVQLLIAVRAAIKDALALGEDEIAIEYDEFAPAITGQRFICVVPTGWSAGPTHKTNTQAVDKIYGVDVIPIMRLPEFPLDRTNEMFLDNVDGMAPMVSAVIDAIDFQYDINAAANLALRTAGRLAAGQGFVESMTSTGVDKLATVPAEFFSATGERRAGLSRRIHFRGARYMASRTLT